MATLRLEQLEAHLARELKSLYAIHGDEPLLALEAADAIRARARASGFWERVVLAAERGFDWGELAASAASRSLFGDRRLVELRLAAAKPGADGAEAIEAYCRRLPPDTLTLVTLSRLDKAGQGSPWFRALEREGTVVNVFPVERARLPAWIAARLAQQKQRANPETLQFLADCVEGNLLAAHQEIQKLALLLPAGEIDFDAVRKAVMSVARYDALKLAEAMLSGERLRLARLLEGLRGEGEGLPPRAWVIAEGNPAHLPRANQVDPGFPCDIDGSDRVAIPGIAPGGAGVGRCRDRGRRPGIPACARRGSEVAGDERGGASRRRGPQDRFGVPKRRSPGRNNPREARRRLVPERGPLRQRASRLQRTPLRPGSRCHDYRGRSSRGRVRKDRGVSLAVEERGPVRLRSLVSGRESERLRLRTVALVDRKSTRLNSS